MVVKTLLSMGLETGHGYLITDNISVAGTNNNVNNITFFITVIMNMNHGL